MDTLVNGNFGALSVLQKCDSKTVEKLSSLKIKGSQIWCLYKDVCKENIEVFKTHVKNITQKPTTCPRGCLW